MRRRADALLRALLALAALAGAAPAMAKPRAPAWLSEAAAAPIPTLSPKVPAIVLLQEQTLTFEESGRVRGVVRWAVRILRYEGRTEAAAHWRYRTDGEGVRQMNAWLIRPAGDVTEYDKKKAVDMASVTNDVYNEERALVLDATEDADVGSVFGYEVAFEQRTFSGQFRWSFQGELPTQRSRFSLTLPPGWSAKGVVFNHAPVEPSVSGSTYGWALGPLPWIEEEPERPPVTSLAPWLAVDAVPPSAAGAPAIASYGSWSRVAGWLDQVSAPSAVPDAALEAKARLLAAGAPTALERIRAIGRYVQNLAYIAIQLNVSRGGGYRPHPAAEVFAKSFGDCKDKANLMKTMLGCLHIESYLVALCAGDPAFVREQWPSPHQFDHCIVAVRADPESSNAVVRDPNLGPLLLFDPTDPDTPLGDVPEEEQGGLALLVAANGGLVRIPVAAPEKNRQERRVEAELDTSGTLSGSIHERSRGQEAAAERRFLRASSADDYRKRVEGWLARGVSRATLSRVAPHDDAKEGRFDLDVDFHGSGYAQRMGVGRMLFNPAIVSRQERLIFTEPTRRYPVMLHGWTYDEIVSTKLPAGYRIEEIPPAVRLERSFGSYSAETEERDGILVFRRSLRIRAMPVPAADYDSLRTFFERVRDAELTPAVLARR